MQTPKFLLAISLRTFLVENIKDLGEKSGPFAGGSQTLASNSLHIVFVHGLLSLRVSYSCVLRAFPCRGNLMLRQKY